MAEQTLLTLSVIQTIAGKAIRDLKNGGKRETRNVIELCRSFAKHPLQQDFWNMIKDYTGAPGSQYDPLLHRIAASVREDSLKTLAINLGCTAFAQGSDSIRNNHANGIDDCWLQQLSFSSLDENKIAAWNERGVYVFLIDMEKEAYSSNTVFSLAAHNARSIFVLLIKEDQPSFSWILQASQYDNLCFLLAPSIVNSIGNLLMENKVLFGVLRSYLDIEDIQSEKEKIAQWISSGCVIDAYYMPKDILCHNEIDDYYKKLVCARKRGSVEIFMCDLQKDALLVQEMILGQRPLPTYGASTV